ncbi:MAG: 16S rRNA (adenine(1518)-N(6)/adenine(1519)-N(6))-dimethyltransferase RsmA [Bacteroidota bacterium]|nr:16S rRNA (adenine(1518)-N(6)/adenine(1519)-N(6))-dimethyltransferase RsmA [Bacteroidota bacterium]
MSINTSRIFVKPKKSLGQNFLIDDNIAKKIVASLSLSTQDVIVEIGPGEGALTKFIIEKVSRLIAVEIDSVVAAELMRKFSCEKLEVINKDILDLKFSELTDKGEKKIRLIGNIPYYLTSEILFNTIDNRSYISDFTVMIQREVAQRIAAKRGTKSYGILSLLTQFYGKPEILFNVSANCFYPKPTVTSAVVRIVFYDELPYSVDEDLFRLIVRTTFGKRRKTLRNGLKFLPFDEDVVQKITGSVDFPLEKRPEELTVEEFVDLTNKITQIIENG